MIDRSMTGYRAESLLSSSFAINNRINVRFLWNRLATLLAMIQSTSLREKHRRVNVNRVFARFLLTFYRLGHLSQQDPFRPRYIHFYWLVFRKYRTKGKPRVESNAVNFSMTSRYIIIRNNGNSASIYRCKYIYQIDIS